MTIEQPGQTAAVETDTPGVTRRLLPHSEYKEHVWAQQVWELTYRGTGILLAKTFPDRPSWHMGTDLHTLHLLSQYYLSPYIWEDIDGTRYITNKVWTIQNGIEIPPPIMTEMAMMMFPEYTFTLAGPHQLTYVHIEELLDERQRIENARLYTNDVGVHADTYWEMSLQEIDRELAAVGLSGDRRLLASRMYRTGIHNAHEIMSAVASTCAGI